MPDDTLHTEEYKGYTIKLYHDEYAESPREWDNLGTMALFHKRYILGDKHDFPDSESFLTWFDTNKDSIIFLPVIGYDHSVLALSTTRQWPFDCPWDSGMWGYIYVTHEKLNKEFPKGWTDDEIYKHLEQEVATYSSYLCGECYSYNVSLGEEFIDACSGYVGEHKYAISSAKEVIDGCMSLIQSATWDRFDICSAYYVYAMLHHPGQFSDEYKIFGRLHNMHYKPAPSLSGPNNLEPNAQAIYYGLVRGDVLVSENH